MAWLSFAQIFCVSTLVADRLAHPAHHGRPLIEAWVIPAGAERMGVPISLAAPDATVAIPEVAQLTATRQAQPPAQDPPAVPLPQSPLPPKRTSIRQSESPPGNKPWPA